jgi:hypothetical protein
MYSIFSLLHVMAYTLKCEIVLQNTEQFMSICFSPGNSQIVLIQVIGSNI